MTTTAPVNNVESSILPPSLFNIQYPNCGRGMFSLREPFKDVKSEFVPTEERQVSTRKLTPAAVQPIEPIPMLPRQKSKRNAEVQCSLLKPTVHHDMAVQTKVDRQQTAVNDSYDDNDIPPQYNRYRKIQPVEQHEEIYEIWDIASPPSLRAIPINQTTRRKELPRTRHRKPIIEYSDEEEVESDYDDERIIYARQPRKTIKKTYLPPNVRMICVRDDANRVSY